VLFDELRLAHAHGSCTRVLARRVRADVLLTDDFASAKTSAEARWAVAHSTEDPVLVKYFVESVGGMGRTSWAAPRTTRWRPTGRRRRSRTPLFAKLRSPSMSSQSLVLLACKVRLHPRAISPGRTGRLSPGIRQDIVSLPESAVARGARAHWLGHLGVEDVERAAWAFVDRDATRLGPTRPTDGGDVAIVRDPGGAVVALARLPYTACAEVDFHVLNTIGASWISARWASPSNPHNSPGAPAWG
jgi:hypothetical protein